MNIENSLEEIKNKFLNNFKKLTSLIEENKKTEHGKVINLLLETESPNLLEDLFSDYYDKEDLNDVLSLFSLLNHAFIDDGGVCIEKVTITGCIDDYENYKIALNENQNGDDLSYSDLELLIKSHKEKSDWINNNKTEYEKSWNELGSGSKEIIDEYFKMSSKIQSLMDEIYNKNKY